MPPAPAAALGPSAGSGGQGGRAVRGRPRAGPAARTTGPGAPSYLRELVVFRVPEEEVQEALGQHHGGAEGLRAAGRLAGGGAGRAGSVGGVGAAGQWRGQLCGRAGQPAGGVIQEACAERRPPQHRPAAWGPRVRSPPLSRETRGSGQQPSAAPSLSEKLCS